MWLGTDDDGMTIELLEPFDLERFDFLDRFLARHGEGPHHLTYKVASLTESLERVRTSGYTPVGIQLGDSRWMEAFLQPREAHGTVVQLAQTDRPARSHAEELADVRVNGAHGEPLWWPDPPAPAATPTLLRRVVLRTPNLDAALGFFAGLLQGTFTGDDAAPGTPRSAELVWPGGGRVLLEERPSESPGITRLELETDGPPRELELAATRLVVGGRPQSSR